LFLPGDAHLMAESTWCLVCIPSLAAMSDDNEMDSTLEYILSDVRGLLWLCPFVPGS
jgi:hypothetical protein